MNRHQAFATAAALAVAAGITMGLMKLGGRGRQRDISADQRRSQDLELIANAIGRWYHTERKLPPDLGAIRHYNSGLSLRDPITSVPYEYRATGDTQYELCASFALDSASIQPQSVWLFPYGGRLEFYSHPAGKQCFPVNAVRSGLNR